MKNLIILSILFLFLSVGVISQNYNRDVHQLIKCRFSGSDVECIDQDVNYKFKIDTYLNWIIVLDSKEKDPEILSDVNIISSQMLNGGVWLYETENEEGKRFIYSFDEKKGSLHITPLFKLNSYNGEYSTFILRFRNPIKI